MPDLLERLNRFPPCVCRVIARDERGRKLTSQQIAERGGISRTTVDRTADRLDWIGVPIETIDGYLYGCRINIFQMRRNVQYIKRLRDSTDPRFLGAWQANYFKRLNKRIGEARAKAKAAQTALVEEAG